MRGLRKFSQVATQRNAEKRREKELSATPCTAIVEVVRKLRGFLVPTQKTDRIMAGQNHTEQRQNHCWQDHNNQGLMILSCHDSVFFLLVAALPRCDFCVSALSLRSLRTTSTIASGAKAPSRKDAEGSGQGNYSLGGSHTGATASSLRGAWRPGQSRAYVSAFKLPPTPTPAKAGFAAGANPPASPWRRYRVGTIRAGRPGKGWP